MFGVVFATLNVSAKRLSTTPRAYAIAASLMKPVIRDSPVPTDMTAEWRTKDRVVSLAPAPPSATGGIWPVSSGDSGGLRTSVEAGTSFPTTRTGRARLRS